MGHLEKYKFYYKTINNLNQFYSHKKGIHLVYHNRRKIGVPAISQYT